MRMSLETFSDSFDTPQNSSFVKQGTSNLVDGVLFRSHFEPLPEPVDRSDLLREIEQLRANDKVLLERTRDRKQVFGIDTLSKTPFLKKELGRLREETFRHVGEGTGNSLDLDEYDESYHHIIVWDDEAQKISGSYRLGLGPGLVSRESSDALYTDSLFVFSDDFREQYLQRGVEFGRSFIPLEYQNSRYALDNLFRGIARFLEKKHSEYPSLRYLYGPVSISASLPDDLRHLLVQYYTHYFPGLDFDVDRKDILPQNPVVISEAQQRFFHTLLSEQDDCYRTFKNIYPLFKNASFPVLFRKYTALCSPEKTGFLSFNTDPDFQNCVDGFLILDLSGLYDEVERHYDLDLKSRVFNFEK